MVRASLAALLLLFTACAAGTTGTGGSGGSGGGATGGSGGGSAAGGGTGGGSATGGGTGGGGAAGGSGGGTNAACSADGGVPGGASKCGCGTYIFCEDFEGAALDAATWTTTTNGTGNTVALDTTRSARGAKSLRVTVKSNAGSTATISTSKVTGNASFFGRAFVYAVAPTPIVHTGMFEGSGGSPNISMRLGIDHMRDIEPNYFGTVEKGIFTSGKTKLPSDKWICLEWEYRSTGEYHFFLDGAEMLPIKVLPADNWPAPAWTKFALGLTMYQPDTGTAPNFEFWFDEVALSTTRITCSN